MMVESLEETRLKLLSQLKEAEDGAKDWQASVLSRLGWTAEHLLQKDIDLDVCPLDPGHCIPDGSRDRHIFRCRLHKDGYTVQEVEAANVASSAVYDGSTSVGTIEIDEESFQEILSSSLATAMSGKTSDQRSMPLTMDRAVTDLSQSERLALYNYCIAKARQMDKPVTIPEEDLMLIQDKKEGNEKKRMSVLERRALERDMKRRRQSYRAKNVHTTKKSYTEILNEVITRQMDLLEQMYQDEQEEEDRRARRQRLEAEDKDQQPRHYRQEQEDGTSRPKYRHHQNERPSSKERSGHQDGDATAGQRDGSSRGKRSLVESEGGQSDSEGRSPRDEDNTEQGDRHRHKKHKKHKHKKHHKKRASSPKPQ